MGISAQHRGVEQLSPEVGFSISLLPIPYSLVPAFSLFTQLCSLPLPTAQSDSNHIQPKFPPLLCAIA
jgi:hypothetical protein